MSDAIMIPCEGSRCYTAGGGKSNICAMCGQPVEVDGVGLVPDHERQDIIAMVKRGDFG